MSAAVPFLKAAIPLGISAFGSSQQAGAAGSAAQAQNRAAKRAAAEQQRQFDISQQQLAPFREAGTQALTAQQALLGLTGPEAQQQAFQQFAESPGQAFLRQRGEQSLLRNASAIGGLGGGNVRSALQQQGIGFAQQDLQNQLTRLSGLSEAGRGAVGTGAQLGAQTATNVGNLLTQGGQARASGILGQQQAQQQFTGQLGGAITGGLAGSGAFGERAQTAFGGTGAGGALLGML